MDQQLELAGFYRRVRQKTEALCKPLCIEDFGLQSMPDASPSKWHLAHTTWFFETLVLEKSLAGYQSFCSGFRVLFNSYYNTIGPQWARSERGLLSRPTVEEVFAYRQHVDRAILGFLSEGLPAQCKRLIALGLHHEQQHQELLLMDLKHAFARNPLRPEYAKPDQMGLGTLPGRQNWIAISGGVFGFGHQGAGFCFDNEEPRHEALVADFEIADRMVTNLDYIEFINDGGYQRPEYWLSDGWAMAQADNWKSPLYWQPEEDGFSQFTLHGYQAVQPDAPVSHISYYEADAFASWSRARLPSEYEWELATARSGSKGALMDDDQFQPRGLASNSVKGKVHQLLGDLWEWTRSPYTAYPNYTSHPGPIGEYNGKFMCNQMVLRGGSFATSECHIRTTYRNFFPPHSRWMFSGIRLARNVE
ncbi:MAG: ergothioneine biosynthesis protein EgtB [Pseudomonadota bacterium]|nr:ergothioneine biosynthesis protein EgtB [Pseudomonadota bacterium]